MANIPSLGFRVHGLGFREESCCSGEVVLGLGVQGLAVEVGGFGEFSV